MLDERSSCPCVQLLFPIPGFPGPLTRFAEKQEWELSLLSSCGDQGLGSRLSL